MRSQLVFWLFGVLVGIVTLLFISIVFDIAQVFFVFLIINYCNGVDLNGWIASLTFFIPLVFLEDLGLRMTGISKRRIMGHNFVYILLINFIFFFFSRWLITFWILRVNLLNLGKWLEDSLYIDINSFFYHFVTHI